MQNYPVRKSISSSISLLYASFLKWRLSTFNVSTFLPDCCLSWHYVQVFCDPMGCSSPVSSVHGTSQTKILEWVAISFSRGSSRPRDQSCTSCVGRGTLHHWAAGQAPSRLTPQPSKHCLFAWAYSLVAQLVKNQHRRPGFNPWVGKIPRRRERLPTPPFWPRESHGLYSPWGCKESDENEQPPLQWTAPPKVTADLLL